MTDRIDWRSLAHREANSRRPTLAVGIPAARDHAETFSEGASWQRNRLRDRDAVERGARALWDDERPGTPEEHARICDRPHCSLMDGYRRDAEMLIAALLGDS